MRIRVDFSSLRNVKWYEHLTRFLLGGLVSVLAGLIAKGFGPELGGLSLAFPAIFPAGASSSISTSERKSKKRGSPRRSETVSPLALMPGVRLWDLPRSVHSPS
jgi:hypothetical protein